MRRRDTQRQKVYRWEKQLGGAVIELDEIRALTKRVVAHFGAKPIYVRDGRGRQRAGATDGWIAMPRWARTRALTLHELAHSLNRQLNGYGAENVAHGREYMAIYLYLLWKFDGRDLFELSSSARIARIDYGSVDAVEARTRDARRELQSPTR
jgi:hypothetical protein